MEGPGQGLPDTDKRNPAGSGAGVSLALPHKKGRRLPVSPATVYLTANATSSPPELGGYGFNLIFVGTPIPRTYVVNYRTAWYLYFQTSISSIKHTHS